MALSLLTTGAWAADLSADGSGEAAVSSAEPEESEAEEEETEGEAPEAEAGAEESEAEEAEEGEAPEADPGAEKPEAEEAEEAEATETKEAEKPEDGQQTEEEQPEPDAQEERSTDRGLTTQEDRGSYNLPVTGNTDVDLSAFAVGDFIKVYDNGGPDNQYSPNANGTLTITLPAGKGAHITGKICTIDYEDYFYVKQGDTELSKIHGSTYYGEYGDTYNYLTVANPVVLQLTSNGSNQTVGLDLTLTIVGVDAVTATFDANGGTGGTVADISAQSGDSITLPANPFTAPNGKYFAGWKSSVDGSICQPGDSVTLTANTTFTAQ